MTPPEVDVATSSPTWHVRSDNGHTYMALAGDWIAQSGNIPALNEASLATVTKGRALLFDTKGLKRWDSGLIEFLWDAKRIAASAGIIFDSSALPDPARKLLQLLPERPPDVTATMHPRFQPLEWLGGKAIALLTETGVLVELSTEMVTSSVSALFGRTRMRGIDLLASTRDAGPSALFIVSVVNFLMGGILAFVGAAQLNKFAAGIYVANLVGLALVREMAAVMTAIVMAGRTGGAYAAHIATMEGNEEIDALKVVGIPISSYLLLPSVLALVFTMPFLYLYGCLVGMFGGFLVSVAMLNVTGAGYFHQTLAAVPLSQFVFGFIKSIAFAFLIGITSCRIGLKAGRSAADVGIAATRAVVTGIVGVIALDAVFAVIANAMDI